MFKADVDESGVVYLDSNRGDHSLEIVIERTGAFISSIDDVTEDTGIDDEAEDLSVLSKYKDKSSAVPLARIASALSNTERFKDHGEFLLHNSRIDGVTLMQL